nr:hypothetical protein CFP56_19262 [Quercus suber]
MRSPDEHHLIAGSQLVIAHTVDILLQGSLKIRLSSLITTRLGRLMSLSGLDGLRVYDGRERQALVTMLSRTQRLCAIFIGFGRLGYIYGNAGRFVRKASKRCAWKAPHAASVGNGSKHSLVNMLTTLTTLSTEPSPCTKRNFSSLSALYLSTYTHHRLIHRTPHR